jgi:hypothetical protein
MRPHLHLPRPDLSAAQFAGLGLLGILITEAIFLAPLPSLMHLGLFYGFLLGMTPVLLGLGLYIWSIAQIKDGVQNGQWTEDQLAPLRRITLSPYLTVTIFALLAVFLAFTLFSLASHAHRAYRVWGWAAYLFLMFITQLQLATKQPTVNVSTAPRIDWRTRPPIQSDHWGQR